MAKGEVPTVFVSSTCYDLRQVRTDIKNFIESLGFSPMLSEYSSFPIDPDIGTVDNCIKAVGEYATLFVLIVGGRYGSQNDGGKSITNLEYLQARAKGIPAYAFVQRSVLDILPVWKSNPEANFTNVVDSPQLFEFVAGLKESRDLWVFPFDTAQDVADALRVQWAHLFLQSLNFRMQAKTIGLSGALLELQGPALQIVVERPILWEHQLFSELLADELKKARHLKRDLNYGLTFGRSEHLGSAQLLSWLKAKNAQLSRIVSALNQLFKVALQEALGPPGTPGDPDALVYVARKMGEAYQNLVSWALEFQHIHVDENFNNLIRIGSNLSANMIGEIEEFSDKMQTTIKDAVASIVPGQRRVLEFKLTLTIAGADDFSTELNRVSELFGD